MKLTNVIYNLIETEKTERLKGAQNVYVFKVSKNATKHAIKKSLKDFFNVDAISVKTTIAPGKKRRLTKTYRFIKTKNWKKAMVQIKEGQKVEL
jgi:large subunit ribosomal protein L23